MLNVKWPQKISSDKLKKILKYKDWSAIIQESQIRWYGHAMRLPEDSPCRQALNEFNRATKRPRGGQKLTWIRQVNRDLENMGINTEKIEEIAQDRIRWKKIVASCKGSPNAGGPAKKET